MFLINTKSPVVSQRQDSTGYTSIGLSSKSDRVFALDKEMGRSVEFRLIARPRCKGNTSTLPCQLYSSLSNILVRRQRVANKLQTDSIQLSILEVRLQKFLGGSINNILHVHLLTQLDLTQIHIYLFGQEHLQRVLPGCDRLRLWATRLT